MIDYSMEFHILNKGKWESLGDCVCYRILRGETYEAVRVTINGKGRKTQYIDRTNMEVLRTWFPWIEFNWTASPGSVRFPVKNKKSTHRYSVNVGSLLRLALEEPYKTAMWIYISMYGKKFDHLRLLATVYVHVVQGGGGFGHSIVNGLVKDPVILTPKEIYNRMDKNTVYETWQPTFQSSFSSNSHKKQMDNNQITLKQYVEEYLESIHTV